jgi:hypothetical protein
VKSEGISPNTGGTPPQDLVVLLFFLAAFALCFFLRSPRGFLQAPIEGLGLSLYYFNPMRNS